MPLNRSHYGKVSPRIYHEFDVTADVDAGYFASSIMNSFPDTTQRVRFLNKFYQCLLVGQLPLKTRKLLAVGPKDSGKSSWSAVLFGLTPEEKRATLSTKEKVFGFSAVNEATQLVFIDEWSHDSFGSDQAKLFLQGLFLFTCGKTRLLLRLTD